MVELLAPPPSFQINIEGELPEILTCRTPLELVFRNLISNSIKHHHQPAEGKVWIRAENLVDFVAFHIGDNGPGIASSHHERIFGLFQRLESHEQVEGSGIGLALVKKTVEHYGGQVQVESTVGQGTTFSFTWPKVVKNAQ